MPAGRHGGGRLVGTILGFTLVSRAVGMLREIIIAAGFGFSRATDGFYQLAAAPTYLVTFLGGPFATAYIAWSNRADAPDEHLRVAMLSRWLAAAIGLVSLAFLAVALRLTDGDGQYLPPLLMALACAATGVVGLGAAVANARGQFVQAQGVLFVNNLGFVLLLGLGALLLRGRVGLALTSAFAGAALVAAGYGWRVIGMGAAARSSAAQRAAVTDSLRRVFLPMLGMAGVETLGFLATQALVLALAAQSGPGVTSAGSLAQRIALTANGLVVGPLANVAMVRLMQLQRETSPEAARRYLLRVAGLTLGGLTLAAATIAAVAVVVARHSHSANLTLLTRLIPAYAVWLVAQGANIMLNRLSFARGAARSYTVITLAGYACANVARYAVWARAGFGAAIAAGAGIELVAALLILGGIGWQRASPAFAP